MSSMKRGKREASHRSSSMRRDSAVPCASKQDLNVSNMINADQVKVVQKHIESNESVVIIPNNDSVKDQGGPSSSHSISDSPTKGKSSMADDGSKNSKSRRGRPNKYIELDSGEIVRQTSVAVKQPEKSTKEPSRKAKTEKEVGSKQTQGVVRKSSRASAGKNRNYSQFIDSDCEVDQSTDIDVTGTHIDEIPEAPVSKKLKRGRSNKKKKDDDEDYKIGESPARRIKSKKTETSKNDTNEPGFFTDQHLQDQVVCGACDTKMTRKMYTDHRLQVHHGLTWIAGEEEPIDYYNTSIAYQNQLGLLVREAFMKFGKGVNPKKLTLPCQNCGKTIASYMGYLSHFTFCDVSDEERTKRMYHCPICYSMITPSGRYFHENKHKESAQSAAAVPSREPSDEKKDTPKRAAALKARGYLENLEEEQSLINEFNIIDIESRRGISMKRKTWAKQLITSGSLQCCYVGCDHSSKDVTEHEKHVVDDCPFKAQNYICSQCNDKFKSEEVAIAHFQENHKSTVEIPQEQDEELVLDAAEDDDEDEDDQIQSDRLTTSSSRKKPKIANDPIDVASGPAVHHGLLLRCFAEQRIYKGVCPFLPTLKWTLEFIRANHSTEILFPKLFDMPEFGTLKDPKEYLPLAQTSVLFSCAASIKPKVNKSFVETSKWRTLNCLDGEVVDGCPIAFAGGPILSMAWCPTPHHHDGADQYLAVSCHRSMDSKLGFQEILPQNNLIQIWSFGLLSSATKTPAVPKLLMTLGHEWGAVRQLEWCPSGCWDIKTNKLGLLAAACADGTIRIIPISSKTPQQPHLKAEASLTLVPHTNPERLSQCICTHWYRGKGHEVVVGGFADGLVCLWNIASESPLLKLDGNRLLPYLKFYAHQGPVVSIKIYPHMKPKFMMTAGILDKNLLFWNLEERGENPIIQYIPKRGRLTALDWMLCWPTQITSLEDQTYSTQVITPRNFMGVAGILPQNSSTSDVATSDWLNCVVHGTGAGEINLFLCNQMVFGIDNAKPPMKERRAMLTRTMVTAFDLHTSGEGFTCDDPSDSFISNYEEASKRGIVFCDTLLDIGKKWPAESLIGQVGEKMDPCCSANYPLTSINRLAWNSNIASFSWIAVGYQCGIIRLLKISAKRSEEIVREYVNC